MLFFLLSAYEFMTNFKINTQNTSRLINHHSEIIILVKLYLALWATILSAVSAVLRLQSCQNDMGAY